MEFEHNCSMQMVSKRSANGQYKIQSRSLKYTFDAVVRLHRGFANRGPTHYRTHVVKSVVTWRYQSQIRIGPRMARFAYISSR